VQALAGLPVDLALCWPRQGSSASAQGSPRPPPAPSVVLDRVVAVVNNQAILASDLDERYGWRFWTPARRTRRSHSQARLEQLIGRALIQQQIRQEDAQAAEPRRPRSMPGWWNFAGAARLRAPELRFRPGMEGFLSAHD